MAEMDNHRASSPRGMRRDMRQLRTHSTATMQEVREFFGSMKGKRPQEVLGLIAQSSLVKGMFLSTLVVTVLLFGLTLSVWGFKKDRGDFEPVAQKDDAPAAAPADNNTQTDPAATQGTPAAQPGTPAAQPGNTAQPGTPAQPGNPAGTASVPAGTPGGDPASAVSDPLGIGETRLADPNVNPLENRGDDILNELNKR